jgi:hypothetical protein
VIAETVSDLSIDQPRRPKPLKRSARDTRRRPSRGAVRTRRPKPPSTSYAALGTVSCAATPTEAEGASRAPHSPFPSRCPVAEERHPLRPKPKSAPNRPATQTPVPDCRTRVTPAGRNRRGRRRADAQAGARLPNPRHPRRPKPKRTLQNRRAGGCPIAEPASPPPAETEEGVAESTRRRVPDCRTRVTPAGRNRRGRRRIDAQAVPEESSKVSHPLRPKPKSARDDPRPRKCPFADPTSPPAAEAEEDGATSTLGRCPFAVTRSAARSRSHRQHHAGRLPDGCPVTATRSAPYSRSRRRHPAPRTPDGCPVTATRSAPCSRSRRRHPAPRIPNGCPAAVRMVVLQPKPVNDHAHIDSRTGCPVTSMRPAPRGRSRGDRSHLGSRTGSPVAVRALSTSRGRHIETCAHRLSDGCPVAAHGHRFQSAGANQRRWTIVQNDCGRCPIATTRSTSSGGSQKRRHTWRQPGGCPRSRSSSSRSTDGRHATAVHVAAPRPRHDSRSRRHTPARLRSASRPTRHPPANGAVRVRRIQPK